MLGHAANEQARQSATLALRLDTFGAGCAAVALGLLWLANSAFADNSMPLQRRYCAGMMQEQRVPLGGRVDCISDEYAIEIEWVEDWYHAVGQSLYYAVVMKRKPGIILLCPDSSVHGEGLCRSYIYRLEAALSLVTVPVSDLGVLPGRRHSCRLHST